jgi:hypothetical protein
MLVKIIDYKIVYLIVKASSAFILTNLAILTTNSKQKPSIFLFLYCRILPVIIYHLSTGFQAVPELEQMRWPYGSCIYNYLCKQCLSLLILWVRIPLRLSVLDTTLWDQVCQWLATGRCFFPTIIVFVCIFGYT